MPSPPLRVPAVGAAVTCPADRLPRPGPRGAGDAAMTPAQVTDTLRRLADLRDRGAISAADYEAKKAELLGRI